jgi:hypothetical protein
MAIGEGDGGGGGGGGGGVGWAPGSSQLVVAVPGRSALSAPDGCRGSNMPGCDTGAPSGLLPGS